MFAEGLYPLQRKGREVVTQQKVSKADDVVVLLEEE